MLVACPISSHAKDVTLSWDASPTQGVTGYRVYTSQQSGMTDPTVIDAGNVLTLTIPDLEDTYDYWFCVKAYMDQNESVCSNIVKSEALPVAVLPKLDFEVDVEIIKEH